MTRVFVSNITYLCFYCVLNLINLFQSIVSFYSPESQILFDGNPFPNDKINLQQFFSNLPIPVHKINTLDSQPIFCLSQFFFFYMLHLYPLTVLTAPSFTFQSVLVSVTGTVRWGTDSEKPFSQTFILTKQIQDGNTRWSIVSDTFRHITE